MKKAGPPDSPVTLLEPDPVVDAYKSGVDRTLLRENLKLTPDERLRKLANMMRSLTEVREALKEDRDRQDS